ncbi:MAG: hypothetical protein RBT69_10540 [Spirochaetia bacterium]|jgi:hypothetical protein|nr:hypothetical protein [Spirochaetia bacterium]
MNKFLSVLAVLLLIFTLSCDSAGSGSDDSENLSEAAGALGAAGTVMGAQDSSRVRPNSPAFSSPPLRDSFEPPPVPVDVEYEDGQGGTATYTNSTDPHEIQFVDFHVSYDDNQYILNGQLICEYTPPEGEPYALSISFDGDVTIEGGSLSGTYNVKLTVSLTLSFPDDTDDIVITGRVTGTVNGESVNISINKIFPAPEPQAV